MLLLAPFGRSAAITDDVEMWYNVQIAIINLLLSSSAMI